MMLTATTTTIAIDNDHQHPYVTLTPPAGSMTGEHSLCSWHYWHSPLALSTFTASTTGKRRWSAPSPDLLTIITPGHSVDANVSTLVSTLFIFHFFIIYFLPPPQLCPMPIMMTTAPSLALHDVEDTSCPSICTLTTCPFVSPFVQINLLAYTASWPLYRICTKELVVWM